MSQAFTVTVVLLSAFAIANLALSLLVVILHRAGLTRALGASRDVLALRLLPAAGALLVTFAVALPAFVACEPARESEQVGPWALLLALLAMATIGAAAIRGSRALRATRQLLAAGSAPRAFGSGACATVEILDIESPLVAVVGHRRPHIVAARSVLAACSEEEFAAVLAHEAAHVRARDNLKLLVVASAPDILAWLPSGAELTRRWRSAAEFEADERAVGAEPGRRLALAAALVKVARLALPVPAPALSLLTGAEEVAVRVRQLLSPRPLAPARGLASASGVLALVVPLLAAPCYGEVQRLIELLVALGS
jgi:beta-lactamase regulating signal transducer with metallopeptidase domain